MSDTIHQDTPKRQCTTCKEWFDATPTFFFRQTKAKDGMQTQCKSCISKPKAPVPDGYKKCKKCGSVWLATLEFFFADKRENDGLRCPCKQCIKDYNEPRKETTRESKRKAYQVHKEEIKQKTSVYAKFHRESGRIYSRLYYAKHYKKPPRIPVSIEARREHKRILYRASYRKNPGYYIAKVNKRKARNRSVLGTHTSQQLHEQYLRQRKKCYYCQNKIEWGEHHVDHTFPLSRVAGTDIPANSIDYLVITCPTCNLRKHNKFPHEWPEGGRLL